MGEPRRRAQNTSGFHKAVGDSQGGRRPACSLDKTVGSPLWTKEETKDLARGLLV